MIWPACRNNPNRSVTALVDESVSQSKSNGCLPMFNSRRILYVQYTNPGGYPPLEHSSHILANAGWQVLFLGTQVAGADSLRFPPHERIRVKHICTCSGGWIQKVHYLWFSVWVFLWIIWWQPHWIYASDLLACPIAWLLTLLPAQRIIYHEHDAPLHSGKGWFQELCLGTRRRLASRTELCVLPNENRAVQFSQATGAKRSHVVCVWNCPRLSEVPPAKEPSQVPPLKLYYHGNLSPALLPSTVLEAVARFRGSVHLTIVGYETSGNAAYAQFLQKEARRLGIERFLVIRTALPRYKLWDVLATQDVGLALFPKETDNFNLVNLIGASNKVFDYLARGLSLLVPDVPQWEALCVEPGYALACDATEPASIAAALQWFLDHPDQMRAMGEAGRQRIVKEWNYETQFHSVWERLKDRQR